MDGLKVLSKIRFRELNLGGSNTVKSLNELEDRLLKTSINSLEKAKQRSLSRLDSEVKGLHHTLREQNAVRPLSSHLSKKAYDSSEFSGMKQGRTSPIPCKRSVETPYYSNGNEEHLTESGDSEADDDGDEDKSLAEEKHIYKGKNQTEKDMQFKMTLPATKYVFSTRLPPYRAFRRQRSTPDMPTSAVAVPSQPRREISSVDSLAAKRDILYASPRLLRRPLTCNSVELATPLTRSSSNLSAISQSIRQREISAGSYSAYARRERSESSGSNSVSFQERCAMVDSRCGDSSPDIPRRKHSQIQQYTSASLTQISRKISCPQPIRGMKQEEFYDLHVNRKKSQKDRDERPRSRSASEFPRLDEPSSRLSCEPDFRNLSVSPVGSHIDGLDQLLQVDSQCGGDSSPDIPRRKHSQIQQYTSASLTQISRKISCPQPIRGMKQEEFYYLHVNRKKSQKDRDERPRSRSASEFPRLDEPSSRLSCEPDFRNLSVSPVGSHIDGLDQLLQVRVNNFLTSLESFR